jgi:Na+-translocating ferredoxin:NAD+ oxidoreductase RnfC subunit
MRQQIAEKVRAAGVVGAGGAGFPTHVKLNASVERVLGNGASCEPLLMSDPYLMEYETEHILRGLQLAMQATGSGRGTLCLKGKHAKALDAVKKLAGTGAFRDIDVFELGDYYPAGDEQLLVYDVMKRIVPEGGIPLQVGAVVSNVESLLNIARAVDSGEPVTERCLTVAGEVARPLVLKAPIGMSVGEVIQAAGGATISDFKVLVGGPMMGEVVSDPATPVTKTTSGVIVLPSDHSVIVGKVTDPARIRHLTKVVCCQCSRCTDLCPRHLLGHSLEPHRIMRQLGSRTEMSRGIKEDALICSECGVCEKYACPMMISPREVNAQIKRELLDKGVKRSGKQEDYRPSAFREVRKIPTRRLTERLRISRYDGHPEFLTGQVRLTQAMIPLRQHLGVAAVPVVKAGDRVNRGDLIGEIPDNALGARVHASIGGVVDSVDGAVLIRQ